MATLWPDEEIPVTDRIANEEAAVRRLVGRFADRSALRAWYEAASRGYELYRLLASMEVAWRDASTWTAAHRGVDRPAAVRGADAGHGNRISPGPRWPSGRRN